MELAPAGGFHHRDGLEASGTPETARNPLVRALLLGAGRRVVCIKSLKV